MDHPLQAPRAAALAAVLLVLPLVGVAVLLSLPAIDGRWHHGPSHLWLVLAAAALNAALAYATGVAAERRADARVALVSLAFLACACFLGLHALATPGVLLDEPNAGFVMATPVGLALAAALAAASALVPESGPRPAVVRLIPWLRWAVVGIAVAWGVVSLSGLWPLGGTGVPARGSAGPVALGAAALALYGVALVRYVTLLVRRSSGLLLAIVAGLALLAEATLTAVLTESWHASWWSWHLMILIASAIVAAAAHMQWHEERFGSLYLESTASGERDISVLFADLQGFTRFSERSDPREVSVMLNRYFGVTVPPIVRSFGGDIDRIMGDALMATFNRGGDRPGHAADALAAAVALQREAGRISEEHPDWPRFRVGVNTGTALVCVLGAEGGRTYTVVGDTVNVAARLEGLAPPGGVALGPETARRVPAALTEPLGSVALKGRDATVDALLLVELLPQAPQAGVTSGRE